MRASTFHAGLNRPRLVAGVSSDVFVMELALVGSAITLQAYLLALLVVPLHAFMQWVHRKDYFAISAYKQYSRQADHYDPWVHKAAQDLRPRGFGKGLHL
ncbi:MAG: VirB3 family type IV secretion system protein [Burkholderiales bacterium]